MKNTYVGKSTSNTFPAETTVQNLNNYVQKVLGFFFLGKRWREGLGYTDACSFLYWLKKIVQHVYENKNLLT